VRQVEARKASASEPLMNCRKLSDGIKTEVETAAFGRGDDTEVGKGPGVAAPV
jgi:hypothetical protein